MRLPDGLKYKIVHAYETCQNAAEVARKFNVNVKTVLLWVRRYRESGGVVSMPRRGRNKVLGDLNAALVVDMLLSNKYGGAKGVARELHRLGKTPGDKPLHQTTIIRHAKAKAAADGHPIRAANGKPKKELSAATIAKRLAFCEQNKYTDWRGVMFSDRSKIHFRYPGRKVHRTEWIMKGEQRTAASPNHPMAVNIYAGITKYGVTKAHVVAGTSKHTSKYTNKKGQPAKNITSAEYGDVVLKTLLPEGKRLFSGAGISHWTLQQDNDPTHKKASQSAVSSWNTSNPGHTVNLLMNWPPNSPDLNLIENVWSWLQAKVDAAGCKTYEEFQQFVLKTLAQVPHTMLKNLFTSMKERVRLCIENGGGRTAY